MQITIIVDDRIVQIDQVPLRLDLDWSVFDGDPESPWDNIHAVIFDTERGQGHVAYKPVRTSQTARPDMVPPDWYITQADFDEHFSFVVPRWQVAKLKADANAEAAEAAEARAAEEASLRQKSDGGPVADTATAAEVEALKAELEALKAQLTNTDTKLNDTLKAAAAAVEGDA